LLAIDEFSKAGAQTVVRQIRSDDG
jgi:hypothetical protein